MTQIEFQNTKAPISKSICPDCLKFFSASEVFCEIENLPFQRKLKGIPVFSSEIRNGIFLIENGFVVELRRNEFY